MFVNKWLLTRKPWDYWLVVSQYIDDDRWNLKKWHPRHDLPQTCGGRKSVFPFWIRLTSNFITHPGKNSGSMNTDPMNKIYTNKKLSKEGLNEELGGYFR